MNLLEREDIEKIALCPLDWNRLKNKTLMISGGTGFIGSFLIEVIKYRNSNFGDKIKVISISRHGGSSNDTVEYLKKDIREPIDFKGSVDYILHLASNTHPKQYGEDPVGTITTNLFGCYNLLELARRLKVKRFLLASSVEIYGQGASMPIDEKYCGYLDCNTARSGYNESKRTCEALCQSYRQQYGIDSVTVRFARVFGPDKKEDSKALAQFVDSAINNDNIILKSKGNQHYSFCYVADAASAIIKVLLDGTNGEAYNVSGDDDGKTLGQYAEYISKCAHQNVIYEIEYNENASKSTYAVLDTSKIKKLGWKPLYRVTEGLLRTYQIKKQPY